MQYDDLICGSSNYYIKVFLRYVMLILCRHSQTILRYVKLYSHSLHEKQLR